MINQQKILLTTALLYTLQYPSISTATESYENQSLAISSNNIYSITVTPNKTQRATNYTLKIYSYSDTKEPSINLTHPLRGQISNVDIIDINNDGKEELVIETTYGASSTKRHRDIFDLEDKTLFDVVKQYVGF